MVLAPPNCGLELAAPSAVTIFGVRLESKHASLGPQLKPVVIVWGKNDQIFPPAGAEPYKRDLKTLEYHLLDTGHFALEEEGDTIARRMREFFVAHVAREGGRGDRKRQTAG